ncbi:dienelactone hydrolase family protein [Rummeliibacillus suwonensis]|uniref:dienelactone hydrolase family protein n=1 Tax=Rummeliibacillus suwonensis TaxID=1306154 RepID=UPI001AAF5653|nr:dienelactone hydrolase family protein [Rummeliibacillus suwonensis]MBO2535772.1 dienelactone hydrolase family protein [Rummeliibacillus suwonensis]
MKLVQSSNRCIILLHEIYGINEHIKFYANYFFKRGYDVFIPNLLGNEEPYRYNQEQEAYQHFIKEIGFERAYEQVLELIYQCYDKYEDIQIVGFSIGATIAWLCSTENKIAKIFGFYGSRIRQYITIEPRTATFLFYGKHEKAFNSEVLAKELNRKELVSVYIFDGTHGFADPYSTAYCEASTQEILTKYLVL